MNLFRDELSRFIVDKRCLTSLKMEGCFNLGGFILSSTSLSTLWLSDLHSLSKMVIVLQIHCSYWSYSFVQFSFWLRLLCTGF